MLSARFGFLRQSYCVTVTTPFIKFAHMLDIINTEEIILLANFKSNTFRNEKST